MALNKIHIFKILRALQDKPREAIKANDNKLQMLVVQSIEH